MICEFFRKTILYCESCAAVSNRATQKAMYACPVSLAFFPFLRTRCCICEHEHLCVCVCGCACVRVCSSAVGALGRKGLLWSAGLWYAALALQFCADFIQMLRKVIRIKSQSIMRVQSTMLQSTVLCSPPCP